MSLYVHIRTQFEGLTFALQHILVSLKLGCFGGNLLIILEIISKTNENPTQDWDNRNLNGGMWDKRTLVGGKGICSR